MRKCYNSVELLKFIKKDVYNFSTIKKDDM